MKSKTQKWKWLAFSVASLFLTIGAFQTKAKAADISADITSTDRSAATCTYKVTGLNEDNTSLTLNVTNSSSGSSVLSKQITLDSSDISDGSYTGSFCMEDFSSYSYGKYTVNVSVGDTEYKAGICDFSIHTDKMKLTMSGATGAAFRTVNLTSTESDDDVLIPGTDNQITVYAWKKGTNDSMAVALGEAKTITRNSLSWTADITALGHHYGDFQLKAVLSNSHITSDTILNGSFVVSPSAASFKINRSNALEKNKAFQISLTGLVNPYTVSNVTFQIYNSKGKMVYSISGTKSATTYTAKVLLKKLDYVLDIYTIKAVIKDTDNTKVTMATTCKADERPTGSLGITKKNNATTVFQISNAYLPGNIKKVTYVVYKVNGTSKTKIAAYSSKSAAKNYKAIAKNPEAGTFKVYVYYYTNWGKKIKLTQQSYTLTKKNLGKQGWYYEKYDGKKYKFYYINNEKQTDLTKILNLKKGTGKYYIEINRAACVTTVFMYNTETKKYDIPVKTFTVCVGRDTSTVAGAGALNLKSSFTPIGNYSICSNGTAVKYAVKPMHEPDGSTVYARWTTHIVGNVYFHSIAVGSNSHYALSAYKYNLLGNPASAGCIRMAVADAKWIYDYMPTGTKVSIKKGSTKKPGPLGKAKTFKIKNGVNYDPTDPGVPNSRKSKDYKAGRISGYLTKSGKVVGKYSF